jgi:hypothetical protein
VHFEFCIVHYNERMRHPALKVANKIRLLTLERVIRTARDAEETSANGRRPALGQPGHAWDQATGAVAARGDGAPKTGIRRPLVMTILDHLRTMV